MELKSSLFILLFIFKTIGDVDCECNLSLKDDFASPTPVLLRNNKFLAPNVKGAISVPRSDIILVACPGQKSIVLGNSSINYNVMEAHCINNKTFRVDRWIGTFNQIKCSGNPFFQSKLTTRKCINGGQIHKIGYMVKSKFYSLYEVCFDQGLLTTYYVKHEILPSSVFMQKSSGRPSFIEGTMFNEVKMSNIYKVVNQKSRLSSIIGANMEKYITKKQFLSKGHLVARADFTFQAEMRATFHYANAAPQWQRGNAGDWASLEDALRRRVHTLGRPVTVYTGTHGVMSLPDGDGDWQPFYLYTDENNNDLVPVPLYNYKLVYDKKTRNATAFVTINSSYYDEKKIKELTFCDDLCKEREFSWLKWRSDDGTHSFCCDYQEFTEKIGVLDDFDTRGPFY